MTDVMIEGIGQKNTSIDDREKWHHVINIIISKKTHDDLEELKEKVDVNNIEEFMLAPIARFLKYHNIDPTEFIVANLALKKEGKIINSLMPMKEYEKLQDECKKHGVMCVESLVMGFLKSILNDKINLEVNNG